MASLHPHMATELKAIFFDLGGTLFSYREIARVLSGVMNEATERLGVDRETQPVGHAFVRASRGAGKHFLSQDYYLHRDLFMESYRRWVEEIEGRADEAFYEWFYVAQRDALVEGVVAREDCLQTLEGLRDRGLSLSIVSNIDDDYLGPILKTLELLPLFSHVSSSEEAESCKPHSGIYHYAMEKAGVVAEEVLFVGDSPQHDIRGAREVGMLSALIEESASPTGQDSNGDEPDFRITSLSDLISVVDGIRQKQADDRS